MTNRARTLALLALIGLFLGSVRGQAVLSLVSFAVIVWILFQWARFQARMRFELPLLRWQRAVNDRVEDSGTLWSGRQIRVRLTVTSPRPLKTVVEFRDVVPEIADVLPSDARQTTWPTRGAVELGTQEAEVQYTAELLSAGRLTFPGVRLTVHDEYGLFQLHRFVALPQSYRVLPKYYESGELRPSIKRTNSLPSHGIHRLQRAGVGSELLELREYALGDPPKSIAWKVSARRDKLLTRQYESEVPVRVHLLVDGSMSTRIGGYGRRLIDQINYVAASIAQAAIAVGDPVDGLLIDETGVKRLPWFSGDRGLLELLKALADFSWRAPPVARVVTPYMLQCGLAVCQQRYPELLDARFNWFPLVLTRRSRNRFLLCGVLAEVFQLSPLEQVACMHDDAHLSVVLQELLWQSGMPWMAPIIPAAEEPSKAAEQRMEVISQAMLKAIAHAHDNEVFVVLADLLSCAPNLAPLARAAKLAIAKHHRVAIICPTTTFLRPKPDIVLPRSESLDDLLLAAETTRVRDLAMDMKRELVRLGASVSFTGEEGAIRMVIAEMDRALDGRVSRSGVRT